MSICSKYPGGYQMDSFINDKQTKKKKKYSNNF